MSHGAKINRVLYNEKQFRDALDTLSKAINESKYDVNILMISEST
ncbi:hypothetical protein [Paenibacillus sp. J2TS4]|nr:hypothetical protein [Paenibacillus sp. J2TS4]